MNIVQNADTFLFKNPTVSIKLFLFKAWLNLLSVYYCCRNWKL